MVIGLFQQKGSQLTRQALEGLLVWLDPDRRQAEEKYRRIRGKLLETFESKGCNNPDIFADETVLRVIKKIPRLVYSESEANIIFEKMAGKVLRTYLKHWVTTKEAFDRLLKWLDIDREQASHKYKRIHTALSVIFRSHGVADAEGLADEAVKRVMRRLPELEKTFVGNPQLYFSGVARKICQEHTRMSEASRKTYTEYGRIMEQTSPPPILPQGKDGSKQHKCFYDCLMHLKSEDRDILLAYYQEEKGEKIRSRKELAKAFGITAGNLRVRIHRAYASLVKCISECMENNSEE
jgi:RNA polymerase sigma factor (sigma-70 family)